MSYSPRKIPLNGGSDSISGPSTTRRAYFCSIVVEGTEKGQLLNQDVQDLIASLGEPLSSEGSSHTTVVSRSTSAPTTSSTMNLSSLATERPAPRLSLTGGSAIQDILKELLTTERSYVNRLRILKKEYADPLRSFARNRDTAIIPPYEAKTLFGNIDVILPVNEAFLADLEKMAAPNGYRMIGGVGDVALKHFRDLKSFDCYKQYYAKREEAQVIFEREALKNKGFAHFIETIKYSTSDAKTKVGLRELLMDPIQRIPRYTMLFRMIIDKLSPVDPQRAKLIEAEEFANKIALCETDDPTKRAAIMYCLERTIDSFPPGLISNNRRFIDCIDVEDVLADSMSSSSSGSSSLGSSANSGSTYLHCTLFLFDDRLMIVKRQSSSVSGRTLAGLDDLEKATKMAAASSRNKVKTTMSCKGVMDVLDVVATDPGGPDMHLYLEKPPQDQTERWNSRPFRAFSVVNPPGPVNFDPLTAQTHKQRFLNHLWIAQANYRARQSRSVVLYMPEREIETTRSGKTTFARTYFNVYHRTAYLSEPKKGKIVLHVDSSGEADPLPFGVDSGPYVIAKVHPMAGDLCRYSVSSRDPHDTSEEDIISTASVASQIVQTIHQYRLFKFRAGIDSAPSTPTHNGTIRSRTGMFGLDSVSRNLFNSRPASVMGDVFGTLSSNHKRTKSAASRASTQTATTTTTGSFKFSTRSASTAPTSVFGDDDDSYGSPSKGTIKSRTASPLSSPGRPSPVKRKAIVLEEPELEAMNESEWNLSMRLELARNNSQKQEGVATPPSLESDDSWQHVVLEGHMDQVLSSAREPSIKTATSDPDSRPASTTPTQTTADLPGLPPSGIPQPARSRRTLKGPRTPLNSPPSATLSLPTETENVVTKIPNESKPLDLESMLADIATAGVPAGKREASSALPARQRPPLEPTNLNCAPPTTPHSRLPPVVEPLSIIKKSSVKKGSPTPRRKQSLDTATKTGAPHRMLSTDSPTKQYPQTPQRQQSLDSHPKSEPTRRGSQQAHTPRRGSKLRHGRERTKAGEEHPLLIIAETTREDIHSSRRAVKKIKLEVDTLRGHLSNQSLPKDPLSALKEAAIPRSPQSRHIANKFTEERMLEMRQLIEQGRSTATRFDSPNPSATKSSAESKTAVSLTDSLYLQEWSKNVETLLGATDSGLKRAAVQHEELQAKLRLLVQDAQEKTADLDKVRAEVEHVKKQCEVVKKFLDDATIEKEVMYDAFNEELDGMFNDASLPETEAWRAMTDDLRKAKDARNQLQMQNTKIKQELDEVRLQKEHYRNLLSKAGLL